VHSNYWERKERDNGKSKTLLGLEFSGKSGGASEWCFQWKTQNITWILLKNPILQRNVQRKTQKLLGFFSKIGNYRCKNFLRERYSTYALGVTSAPANHLAPDHKTCCSSLSLLLRRKSGFMSMGVMNEGRGVMEWFHGMAPDFQMEGTESGNGDAWRWEKETDFFD
jgi:hypothetical protein